MHAVHLWGQGRDKYTTLGLFQNWTIQISIFKKFGIQMGSGFKCCYLGSRWLTIQLSEMSIFQRSKMFKIRIHRTSRINCSVFECRMCLNTSTVCEWSFKSSWKSDHTKSRNIQNPDFLKISIVRFLKGLSFTNSHVPDHWRLGNFKCGPLCPKFKWFLWAAICPDFKGIKGRFQQLVCVLRWSISGHSTSNF